MLRALLEERFHLKLHRAEDQNVDMFALTVAKGRTSRIKPWGAAVSAPSGTAPRRSRRR